MTAVRRAADVGAPWSHQRRWSTGAVLGLVTGLVVGTCGTWWVGRRRERDVAHDVRGSLAVVGGEVELVLSDPRADAQERARSAGAVLAAVARATEACERRRDRGRHRRRGPS